MEFAIGQKVMIRDEVDELFVEAEIVNIFVESSTALVTYEDDYHFHEREFTFDQLREWQEEWDDVSMETRSWF